MKQSKLWFVAFVGPMFLAFTVVVIFPMLRGFYFAFTEWNTINNDVTFIGFDNFAKIIEDETFRHSFIFTFEFALVAVITINLVGFGLALLVTRGRRASNIQRSIFYLPNLIGGLILGFVWQFIFIQGFKSFGDVLGVDFLDGWLATEKTGFYGLVILMTWQMAGYMMVIYIAAIQSIPEALFEAAKIDGAGIIKRIQHITIPLVMPAFTIGLFLSISNSFKLFDQNLALTGGGPYSSTEMLALNIYNTAFAQNNAGYAQAKAVIFLIVVAGITLTQMAITKKREVEM